MKKFDYLQEEQIRLDHQQESLAHKAHNSGEGEIHAY